jgi:hypothetical protein
MSGGRIRTEEVLMFLGARGRASFLEHLRAEGLFESEELDPDEADELRVAQVLMDELGVNAAGVEVALHLRRRLRALEQRARALADALSEARGSPSEK